MVGMQLSCFLSANPLYVPTDSCDNSEFHASPWNVDEKGFNSDSLPCAVVAGRTGLVRQQHTTSQDHMSANVCINACGSNKPPQIIFNRKQLATSLVANGPPRSLYSTSIKGSMDQELFLLWLRTIFLAHTTHDQTQQLVMDNHSSHISLAIIKLARASNVISLALPSNTMHILQPLDTAVFCSLAAHHATITTSVWLLKPNHCLNIADFVPIFRDA